MIYTDIATWVGPTGNEVPHGMGDAYGVVLHIQEGTEAGTESWQKNPASQVSSHFLAPKTGRLRQMVDTADRAWCEVAGNSHWWSIEIEGHHGDSLTADQLEACAQVLARAHRDEAVPLAVSSNPNATTDAQGGLGYHAMGGDAWGGHFDCPGQPIINARPAIVARAQQIAGGTTMTDLDTTDPTFGNAKENIYTIDNVLLAIEALDADHPGAPWWLGKQFPRTNRFIDTVLEIQANAAKAASAAGAPVTQDQVDAAVLKALADPTVIGALATALGGKLDEVLARLAAAGKALGA